MVCKPKQANGLTLDQKQGPPRRNGPLFAHLRNNPSETAGEACRQRGSTDEQTRPQRQFLPLKKEAHVERYTRSKRRLTNTQ